MTLRIGKSSWAVAVAVLAIGWSAQGGFVRPQTTRRYLHGPLSERVAVFFREGKLTLGENIHRDNWGAMRYWKGTQPAHGVWLVHGADDAAFDFRKAVLNRDPDGVPVHSQTWREGDLEVELAACMPVGLRTSIQARLTVTNRGTTPQAENVGFLLRAAPENKLVFGAPDIYKIYAPDVQDWRQLPSTFRSGAEATFADGDRFASFCGAPRWDAQAGAVRFAFELAPGASRTVDFAVGKGPVERPDFASAAAAVRAEWAKLLSRAKDRTPFVRGQIVQILQCFGQAKDEAFVLPRQGGLQRFVWPGETVHVVEALDRLGYGEYGAMAIDFLFRFARPDGKIGPFANDWASETAYVLETLARHCLVTDDRACWQRHRAAAWRGFEWIVAKRAETAAGGDGVVAGLFPPLKSTDSAKRFQHWGMTDLVNEHALKVFGEAADRLGEPEAAKVIAEWRAYRAVIERVLDRWCRASSGRDTFFIPLAPDGANEAKFRAENFFYLHPGAFAEGGYLSKDEMLRLRTWLVREGIANEVGFYQHHPSSDPTLGNPIWYTTWSEYQWSVAWRRVGCADLAHQSLEALLKWSVTDEGYVGERIHEETPWYYPWSPNASGSARLIKMLMDEGRTERK